jgi:uncharacterized protein YyaL (SSP411 family)
MTGAADAHERLAEALSTAMEALRRGAPAAAIPPLRELSADADLAAADDLRDVRARVLTWLAGALADTGALADAEAPCREALRLWRALRDKEGLDAARQIQDRIVRALAHDAEAGARAAEAARVAATPVESLLAEAGADPRARALALVRKATALEGDGAREEAAALAARALEEACGDVHGEVMAHLVLARVGPGSGSVPSHLHAAWAAAAAAEEFNLVSMVARAAELAGVEVGALEAVPSPPEGS